MTRGRSNTRQEAKEYQMFFQLYLVGIKCNIQNRYYDRVLCFSQSDHLNFLHIQMARETKTRMNQIFQVVTNLGKGI